MPMQPSSYSKPWAQRSTPRSRVRRQRRGNRTRSSGFVFRALLYLLVTVVVITVLRAVMGIIGNLFSSETPQTPRAPSQQSSAPQALKKDPVCGTFVAAGSAIQKEKSGQVYYFCSPACRDKFV